MDAHPIRCASCGASARSDSPMCAHCGGLMAMVACPRCFQKMIRGAQFCSACGTPTVDWPSTPGKLPCPECKQPLRMGDVGSCQIHHCSKCFGIWLDTATFTKICRDTEQQMAVLGMPQIISPAAASATFALPTPKYRPCPLCSEFMNRVNFARCSGVVIDVCRTHGTWFDHQELHRIIQFVQRGGLSKSRALELEALEEERRRTARSAAMTPPSSYPMDCGPCTSDVAELSIYAACRIAAWILSELF